MRCAVCEKESNNRRVCPYCFTPYGPAEPAAPVARPSTASSRPAAPEPSLVDQVRERLDPIARFVMRQSPVVRWSALGIALMLVVWLQSGPGSGADLAPGSVPSNVIATPMQREVALALLKHTRETALVDTQSDEVHVSYPAATFPVLPEGQVALAQQYARADELVEGRKRRIFFYNPNGRVFAQSDGVTGVTIVR